MSLAPSGVFLLAAALLASAPHASAGDPPDPKSSTRPAAAAHREVTVVRDSAGRVSRIEGPGFRVERAEQGGGRSAAPDAATPAAGRRAPERKRVETPIFCNAGERREIRDVELVVEGAGIVARRGCALEISGTEVRAGGWALVIEDGAQVRVDASVIEGRTGSVDASPGASLSAWSTLFRGPPGRPLRAPEYLDRGGNAWD